ncbi:hypothetical protein KSS87_006333, partial [Heliosperma pusillum]
MKVQRIEIAPPSEQNSYLKVPGSPVGPVTFGKIYLLPVVREFQ